MVITDKGGITYLAQRLLHKRTSHLSRRWKPSCGLFSITCVFFPFVFRLKLFCNRDMLMLLFVKIKSSLTLLTGNLEIRNCIAQPMFLTLIQVTLKIMYLDAHITSKLVKPGRVFNNSL